MKVILYDSKSDILLESEAVSLMDDYRQGELKESTLLFIWLFINHRQFLPEDCDLPHSTIKDRLMADNKLANFKALQNKERDWSNPSTFVSESESSVPVMDIASIPPPHKRARQL